MSSRNGDDEGSPAAKKSRLKKFYGGREMSDAILQVENVDLHVNKTFLAVKSPYFKNLFFANGSEEQKTFVIDEMLGHFELIMDAVYNHLKSYHFTQCDGAIAGVPSNEDPKSEDYLAEVEYADVSWKHNQDIMAISEKYEVLEDIRTLMTYCIRMRICCLVDCLHCTMRKLFALHYDFQHVEKTNLDPECVVFCLKRIGTFTDTFNMSAAALEEIVGGFAPERTTQVVAEPPSDSRDNSSQESDTPIVMEYGDMSLTDVTLVIGICEFKVHKMYLANHSAYFRAMFFSGFNEKDKDRVVIEADGEAFKLVMELLYRNDFDHSEFLECRPGEPLQSAWLRVLKFWKVMPEVMKALEFFNCPPQTVENPLLLHYCRRGDCVECATKRVFAMIYNLDNLKKKISSTPISIASCIKNFAECLPEQLSFAPNDLAELIEFLDEKKTMN